MSVIQELSYGYSRHRFALLFCSLLFTLVASPVFAALGLDTRFMEAFVALNVLGAVFITLYSLRSYVVLGLLVLALVTRGGYGLLGYAPLLPASQAVSVLIFLICGYIMLRFMFSAGSINSERIFAALSVYIMIGLICGLLFFIFEEQWPGSFAYFGSSSGEGRHVQLAHAIYFSFVTLGTLGYGDMVPIGGPVQALAVMEAIGGQMYLAVVVARLVSLYRT
jgi:hypothetical protein